MSGIAQAHAIAEASKEAMTSFDVMMCAAEIVNNANNLTQDELVNLMFKYSGILAASVATRVTHVCMTEADFDAMVSDVQMFAEIERDVFGE